MTYDATYFITKFQAIPEDKWFVGDYHNEDFTKHCVLGHCQTSEGKASEKDALSNLFSEHGLTVAHVNDGLDIRYPQPTPRQRILAALRDIQKAQQPVKTVYVVVPETILQECEGVLN